LICDRYRVIVSATCMRARITPRCQARMIEATIYETKIGVFLVLLHLQPLSLCSFDDLIAFYYSLSSHCHICTFSVTTSIQLSIFLYRYSVTLLPGCNLATLSLAMKIPLQVCLAALLLVWVNGRPIVLKIDIPDKCLKLGGASRAWCCACNNTFCVSRELCYRCD
jgi:hypothetical protein